jgi:myosin heavy subunit
MSYVSIITKLPLDVQLPILELIESVEANLRQQLAVRREDFDELQLAIGKLTQAQQASERRLDRLDIALTELAEAQKRTEQRVEELAEAQKRTEQRVEELAEAQKRTEQRVEQLAEGQIQLLEGQKQINERVSRLEIALTELAEAQKHTELVVAKMVERQDRMQIQLDKHTGYFLEGKYRARPYAFFARVLRKARSVPFDELEEQLEARLSAKEVEEVALLDLLVRGRPKQIYTDVELWLAVEISATIDRGDVERALRRAAILRDAGYPTAPTVAGETITQGAYEQARQANVIVVQNGSLEFWDKTVTAVFAA